MPITPEMLMDFAEDYEIETFEDLENFREFIHLLYSEPNVPLAVIN
jgi:hypothetical protein